jgi:hypothetical protein
MDVAHPLSDLAYVNVFAQKSQPFAYSGYVPGHLPAKDGYPQWSYCSTFGQNNFAYLIMYFGCVNKFA